jgi:hypothetical protein
MKHIKAIVVPALASAFLLGCSYTAERSVRTTSYAQPGTTVTTTTYPPSYEAPAPPNTNQVVTTVRRNADGSVTRTTTRYYYPPSGYAYVDDGVVASDVRSALRQDPGVSAHARNIGISSDGGTVEIVGTADSISAVQQASWDAVQIPGVQQVNNDMRIDSTSPG